MATPITLASLRALALALMWILLPGPYKESRYGLADAIATSCLLAPPFLGPRAEERCVALAVAVARFESGLHHALRGDHGHSCTPFGLWLDERKCRELEADDYAATLYALDVMKKSLADCEKLPFDDRLSEYASGQCGRGVVESRHRIQAAKRALAAVDALDQFEEPSAHVLK